MSWEIWTVMKDLIEVNERFWFCVKILCFSILYPIDYVRFYWKVSNFAYLKDVIFQAFYIYFKNFHYFLKETTHTWLEIETYK